MITKQVIVAPAAVLFLLLGASCDGGTNSTGDALEDTIADTAEEPQADVLDTPTDRAEDIPADPSDEEAPPVQEPITFIVRNVSAEAVYLDWQTMGNNFVDGGRTTGAAIMPISYWTPFCMQDCSLFDPVDNCCIECMPPPAVRVLDGGEELTFDWDGRNVYEVDSAYCLCPCYRAGEVTPMAYIASACVYHTYTCWGTGTCEPSAEGIISYSNVEGEPACAETMYDIPYAGTEVVIEVQ